MQDVIKVQDAVITIHASMFDPTQITVECRGQKWEKMSVDEFAALVYPAIDAAVKQRIQRA